MLTFRTIAAFTLGFAGGPADAAWQDEIGFTRLKLLAAGDLPTSPPSGVTQVEAPEGSNYAPDTGSALFTGKTFTQKSGASGISSHAQHVGLNFYGNTSLLPGTFAVDCYGVSQWAQTGFLNYGTTSAPQFELKSVQNHSWVGSLGGSTVDTEVSRRIDFAIDRDGFICAVGSDNNGSTVLPNLLSQTYNTIVVGRDDGGHSAGLTAIDGSGRMKPDIVAPSAAPEYATSWTTPMVAGTAGMLVGKLAAAPYSLAGPDKPRVTKALLLAGATKDTVPGWDHSSASPLDSVYGAGELNAWHAYTTLRAGRVTASGSVQHGAKAWAAESLSGNSSKTYYLHIPNNSASVPFCAALTWHRIVKDNSPGPSWGMLTSSLSDLNLRLYQASGFTTGTLLAESTSGVDNVELVHQATLPPGDYALVVQNTSAAVTGFGLAWTSPPVVSIAATTSPARESDLQAGVFTISRTGDTELPLLVPISSGGTAVSGQHFVALPNSVTIPAGQSSTVVQAVPIADDLAQGDRMVSVSVNADFTYVIGASAAEVTIEDKPFDAWRFANFNPTELANPAVSGASADPDGDQLSNLLEYGLNSPPKTAGIAAVTVSEIDGYLAVSTSKNPAASDLVWSAEISADVQVWDPAVTLTDTASTFEARDVVQKNSAYRRFIRLKVEKP
jgi:hypothetical protein